MIGNILGAMEVFGLLCLISHYVGSEYLNNWQLQLACLFIIIPIVCVAVTIIKKTKEENNGTK